MGYKILVDWTIFCWNCSMGFCWGYVSCTLVWWSFYCLGYNTAVILKTITLVAYLNMQRASLEECLSHLLDDHWTRFPLFSAPDELHPFDHGMKIHNLCLVSSFTLNCFYCFGGTRCCYIGLIPPMLDECIHLDEELLPPAAIAWRQVWAYNL